MARNLQSESRVGGEGEWEQGREMGRKRGKSRARAMAEGVFEVLGQVKKVLDVAAGSGSGSAVARPTAGAQLQRQARESPREEYQSAIPSERGETEQQRGIRGALEAHNSARRSAKLNVPSSPRRRQDLVWSQTLSSQAQAYADEMARKNIFEHSSSSVRGAVGENLYPWIGYSREPKRLVDAVEAWVDEKKYYNGQKAGTQGSHKWGHYSQIIWPGTMEVGMGIAQDNGGKVYVVGRYWPQGNIRGRSAWDW